MRLIFIFLLNEINPRKAWNGNRAIRQIFVLLFMTEAQLLAGIQPSMSSQEENILLTVLRGYQILNFFA